MAGRGGGQGRGQGQAGGGRGRQPGGRGIGPAGKCKCPNCGHEVEHQRGVPCYERDCPKCGTKMIRP